jgi:hypothetical protein
MHFYQRIFTPAVLKIFQNTEPLFRHSFKHYIVKELLKHFPYFRKGWRASNQGGRSYYLNFEPSIIFKRVCLSLSLL